MSFKIMNLLWEDSR